MRDYRGFKYSRQTRLLLSAGVMPIAVALAAPSPASAQSLNLCVSVLGASLGTCTLTNVAAGVAPTDAVNVSQLTNLQNAVNTTTAGLQTGLNGLTTTVNGLSTTVGQNTSAIAADVANTATNTANIATNTSNLNTLTGQVATLGNNVAANATGLTNVNSQLGTLTSNLNTATGNISTLTNNVAANTTAIANNATALAVNTANTTANTTNLNNLTGQVTTLGNTVASNTAGLADATTKIGTLTSGLNTATGNITALTNTVAGNTAAITNNAAALATTTANTAANTTNLTNLTGQVTTLGNTVASNTAGLADATTKIGTLTSGLNTATGNISALTNTVAQNTTAAVNNAAAIATNTANIATNTQNINTLTGNVATNANAITDLGTQVANGAIGALRYVAPTAPTTPLNGTVTNDLSLIGNNQNAPVSLHNVASGTVAAGSTDAVNGGQVFALGQTLNSLSDLAVSYNDPSHAAITLGGTGSTTPVGLGNLAAGTLSAASTAAVNGAQLFATNTAVDANTNNILQNTTDIGNLKTTVGATTDALTGLNNTVTGQANQLLTLGGKIDQTSTNLAATVANVAQLTGTVQQNGQAITDLGAQVTAQNGEIEANANALGTNADAILQLRQLSATGAIGPVRYSNAATPTTPNGGIVSNDVTIVGATSDPVHVHNVANGDVSATSTDAINGSQLFAFESQIGSPDGLAVTYDDNTKLKVTLGGVTATTPVTLTNVANASLSATSTDAVNGSQLFATNTNVTNLTNNYNTLNQNVTNVSNNLQTLQQSAVTYDDGTHTKVTFGNLGSPTTLTNVADGRVALGSSDAVTGNQLFATNTNVTNVNSRVDVLNNSYNTLSLNITNGAVGPVQYSYAVAPRVPNGGHMTNDLTLVGADIASAVGLHNVAAGSVSATSTDAINGSQLFALESQIGSPDGLAVTYNDATKTKVTLGGVGDLVNVSLTNVAAANLSATSTDAVNGSQLFATNTNVANLNTTVTNNYNSLNQSISTLGNTVTNYFTTLNNSVTNLGTTVTNNYNTLNQNISNVTNNLASLQQSAVTYDDATHTKVTFGTPGVPTTLTNVADGRVALGSTDAVTGNQLFQTNTNVTNVNNRVDVLNNSYNALTLNITNGAVGPVQYSYATAPRVPNGGHMTNDVTLVGADITSAVGLHNVAAGNVSATSTDAINGSQLFAFESQIGSSNDLAVTYNDSTKTKVTLGGVNALTTIALTNVANANLSATSTDAVNGSQLFQTNTNVANLNATVTNNYNTLNQNVSNVNSRVDNLNTTVTNNYNTLNQNITSLGNTVTNNYNSLNQNITNLGNTVTNNYNSLNQNITNVTNNLQTLQQSAVTYDDSTHTKVTFGNLGSPTTLTNVADGRVAAGSSDVVTGNQLFATNTNVTNVNNRVDVLNNNYNALTLNITNGAVGPVQYSYASTPMTPNGGHMTNDVTLVGADITSAVGLHNVADGKVSATSTDAINGSQLYAFESQIGSPDGLAVTYDDSTKTKVTLGGVNAATTISLTNVANGNISSTSTDAVNGSQLFVTNNNVTNLSQQYTTLNDNVTNVTNQVSNLTTNVATNTTDISNLQNNYTSLTTNITNGAIGPVQYSSAGSLTTPNGGTPTNDLTLVGADTTAPVGLHNVAAGVIGDGSTDAINGSQLGALGNAVAGKLGGVTYNPTTNSFTGNFTYGGNSYSNVQAVFNAIGDNGGGGTTDTASKYFHANSDLADSNASGTNSTAIGPQSSSAGAQSVAMGSNASAQSDQSVAIGSGAVAKDGKSVSIGQGNIASGNGAVAIGDPSSAVGDGAVVLGKDDNANGVGAIALGNTNTSTGDGAAAIGSVNTANGQGAVALGANNTVSGLGSIAVGSGNNVTGNGSLAIGSGITTNAVDTLAIGTSTKAAANSAVALGNRAQATGVDSLSVGTDTTATGLETSTFGQHADATADYATAIGSQAQGTGLHSVALGYEAESSGERSTALGADAVANAAYTLAVGQMSTASARGGVAVGLEAQATGYASTALGSGAIADQEGSVALGSATQTTRGAVAAYQAFGVTGNQTSLGEVAIARNLSYEDLTTGIYTPTGNRQMTGLAAGSADTDAVNVAQLKGVSSSLGNAIAGGFGGGSSYNSTTGAVTGPSYTLFGTTYSNVGDALNALASFDSTAGGGNSILDPNAVRYTDNSHANINLAGNGTQIHNLADGTVAAGSTDAVNGSQLAATNAQVAANTTAVTNLTTQVQNGAIGPVQYSNTATPTQGNGGTKTNDVTLVGANTAAPVGVHNVADGQVAAGSTDAVNGSQLAATNTHIATVEGTADKALSMSQNAVQYDSGGGSVTLGGADSTTPMALHNVAAGTSANDAVNLGQLANAASAALGQANAYTDSQIAKVQFDLGKVHKEASAGVAGAMALAAMPQPYEAGKGMISGGVGTYQGQTAFAVGVAKALADEHTVFKLGATYNTRGEVGLSGGVGYQF